MSAWLALALCLAFLGGCSFSDSGAPSRGLTLMVYMAGSNLESEAGAATDDLRDMMQSMPDDGSLSVIVLASGAERWHCDIVPDETNIYLLTRQGIEILERGEPSSMGDPSTLERLLDYGYRHFPADRYALILWDHGAGPMGGVCFDEVFQDGGSCDGMTLQELGDALAASPFAEQKLSWIGFDACLMASLETATVAAPYAEYMIASQEAEPTEGWDYRFLADAAEEQPLQTASSICESYYRAHSGALKDVTISCIDLSGVSLVNQEMDELFGNLEVSPDRYAVYAGARRDAIEIDIANPCQYDLVDLVSLSSIYCDKGIADAEPLLAALSSAIALNYSNHPGRNGLSIYYPLRNKARYVSPWGESCRALSASRGYASFVSGVGTVLTGESLSDWNSPHVLEQNEGNPRQLILQLDENQASQLQDARLVVVSEQVPGQYTFIYSSEDVDVTPQGVLWKEYVDESLYFVDGEGVPQTGSLYYEFRGDSIVLPAALYKLGGSDTSQKRVYLTYRRDERGSWRFADMAELDETGVKSNRSTLSLGDFDVIAFEAKAHVPTYGEGGACLPFSEWEYGSVIGGYELNPREIGELAFLNVQDSHPHFAFFEITDFQGQTVCSEMMELPNPNRLNVSSASVDLVDNGFVTVTISSIDLAAGDEPSLQIDYAATSHADRPISVRFENYRFDEKPSASGFWGGSCSLDPGETKAMRVYIGIDDLYPMGITTIGELGFDITCSSAENEELSSNPVSIPLSLDISGVIAYAGREGPS